MCPMLNGHFKIAFRNEHSEESFIIQDSEILEADKSTEIRNLQKPKSAFIYWICKYKLVSC